MSGSQKILLLGLLLGLLQASLLPALVSGLLLPNLLLGFFLCCVHILSVRDALKIGLFFGFLTEVLSFTKTGAGLLIWLFITLVVLVVRLRFEGAMMRLLSTFFISLIYDVLILFWGGATFDFGVFAPQLIVHAVLTTAFAWALMGLLQNLRKEGPRELA